MNNFFKSILLFAVTLLAVSCSKSDSSTEPLRDYAEQYATDMANIEKFMKTHYMEVVNNPGATNDQDVTFTLIPPNGTQVSIWDQTDYPKQTITLEQNDITYTMYYLQLRQGSGPTSKSPCNVDRVLTSYRGEYIYKRTEESVETIESKQFEELINPQSYFNLSAVITGWSEVFPKFKTGSYVGNADGTISYFDFGAGVMFIPSGLAYYASSTGTIPSYSPLIFSFKLYEIQRTDFDGDGEADILVIRNESGQRVFYIRRSSDGAMQVIPWGLSSDVVKLGDYDGDGKTDPTVTRAVNGQRIFYILQSSNNQVRYETFGVAGDF